VSQPVLTSSAATMGGDIAGRLLEKSLCRIRLYDRDVRAFVRLAAGNGERGRRMPSVGCLHGLPVGIKDTIDTAGLATSYGSSIHDDHVPAADADCVRRLRNAGAIVVGKTAATEFAHVTPTATRNPWNYSHTPGGSSSGSAAAVAAGMVPLALGTQTGGSVIRPASYCGVFGFKCSLGRAEMRGVHPLAPSLDSLGWFADSSAHLSSLGSVLLVGSSEPVAPEGPPRLGRLRIRSEQIAEPAMVAMCDNIQRCLTSAGLTVVDIALPEEFDGIDELHQRIVSAEASQVLAPYEGSLSPALSAFLEFGRACRATYGADLDHADCLREGFERLAGTVDAFFLPAATGEAPQGLRSTGNPAFSLPFSLLGLPCASIPAETGPCGLPLGLQLVGRPDQDEKLLHLVGAISALLHLEPIRLAPLGIHINSGEG
jgi:Asp-tRNA(Asn)/Glu-tRNA(Gln) amidotransferase A subunit family amidase